VNVADQVAIFDQVWRRQAVQCIQLIAYVHPQTLLQNQCKRTLRDSIVTMPESETADGRACGRRSLSVGRSEAGWTETWRWSGTLNPVRPSNVHLSLSRLSDLTLRYYRPAPPCPLPHDVRPTPTVCVCCCRWSNSKRTWLMSLSSTIPSLFFVGFCLSSIALAFLIFPYSWLAYTKSFSLL